MRIVQRGRLKVGQLGGSINIPPGTGHQAHRITVSNTEGAYPNTCESVKAELILTYVHTGQESRIAGLFAQTDGQKITSEPTPSVSLKMLESAQLLLLCRDSINAGFHTLTGWPFDPESETRLEFGDWRLEINVSSVSHQDVACAVYDVRLKPDLSSAWSPFQGVLPSAIAQPTAPAPRAFVSHSAQDHTFVEGFAADLRANGVDVWFSAWEIKPGDSIRQKIDEGLEGCKFFIIALSKNSISRPWVQTELDAATIGKLNGKVQKIIPIKIEDCGDLPPTLASLCWEDFSTRPYRSALQRVLDSVFEIDVKPALGSPPTIASSPQRGLRITSLSNRSPDSPGQGVSAGSAIFPPIHMDDLGTFADKLRGEGFDARCDLFNGQLGLIVGPSGLDAKRLPPDAGGLFLPLWELNWKANRAFVHRRDFHDIFESRPHDWQFNTPYPEESTTEQHPPTTSGLKDSQVRLTGPDDVDLVLETFVSDQGKHGVLARIHNRRITNLPHCDVLVRDVRSFDVDKGLLRDSSGFKPTRIIRENCAAGFESRNAWLVRIEADHLEVGDTVASGIMHWPSADKSGTQKWRLSLSVAVEGSQEWTHEVDANWERRSNIIRLGMGTRTDVDPELPSSAHEKRSV